MLPLILTLFCSCESARILSVFPVPLLSHQLAFRPLTQELARRGHEVVVLTTYPAFLDGHTPGNFTEISLKRPEINRFAKLASGNKADLYNQLHSALFHQVPLFKEQFFDKQVQDLIANKTQKFDLLIIECASRSSLVFSYIYNTPVIQISSFGAMHGTFESMGAPVHPILYPINTRQKINNFTFWDKIHEIYMFYRFQKLYEDHDTKVTLSLKENYPNMPSIGQLSNNVAMFFLNIHRLWDANRPVPPSVLYVGGIHQAPEEPLPDDLELYLDNSKHGIIYVSFGTICQPEYLPPMKIQMLVNVFSQLPYNIVWKWDSETNQKLPKNIKIGKWFPQANLLRHKNIKLFITHGGLQSVDEAIVAGVPLIGLPMLGDHWYNTELSVKHGIGKQINFERFTEEQLKNYIFTVINDKSYRNNVVKLRTLLYDQPQTPLDRAIWWIEHVLRHGGRHLRAAAANMSWAQYLELEVVFILIVSLMSVCIIIVIILQIVLSYIRKFL